MPAGVAVTAPGPVFVTVSGNVSSVNVAMQVRVPAGVREPSAQSPSPLQPANVDPVAGVAVSVTGLAETKSAVHVLPQSIPAGSLVTVPAPLPAVVTVRWRYWRKCSVPG